MSHLKNYGSKTHPRKIDQNRGRVRLARWPRFGYSSHMERFERFRFSILAVPLKKGFLCVSAQFKGMVRFRFRFRFLENGPDDSGSHLGSWKTVPTVPGSGSGSVPARFWVSWIAMHNNYQKRSKLLRHIIMMIIDFRNDVSDYVIVLDMTEFASYEIPVVQFTCIIAQHSVQMRGTKLMSHTYSNGSIVREIGLRIYKVARQSEADIA